MATAIKKTENSCGKIGTSGERSCYQFMAATWQQYSAEVIGYVAPLTERNAEYVAMHKVQGWLSSGLTPEKIALKWNQGHIGRCRTKAGVYDSCGYRAKFVKNYQIAGNN